MEIVALCWEAIDKFPADAELYIRPLFYFADGFVTPDFDSARFMLSVFEAPSLPERELRKVLPIVKVESRAYQQGPFAALARQLYFEFAAGRPKLLPITRSQAANAGHGHACNGPAGRRRIIVHRHKAALGNADGRERMGKFLRNYWYACAWDYEVDREILARTIVDEPIILFRSEDGTPFALEDRCCHRHLPLSMGKLIGDRLQCGYHGLVFNTDGKCVTIPGQTKVPPGASIRSYPVIEQHRFVWIWMGDPALADISQIPDYMSWNDADGWTTTGASLRLECDYRLLVDNLLDLTHETYVHIGSLGNEAVVEHPIKTTRVGHEVLVTRWMIDHEPAPFWKAAIGRPENCDRWQMIHYNPPANVCLDVGVAVTGTGAPDGDRGQGVNGWNLNAITPETEGSCWQFWAFTRNFKTDDEVLTKKLHETVIDIFNQDKRILEAQQKSLDTAPPEFQFVDVEADAGIMQARREIDAALKHEAEHG